MAHSKRTVRAGLGAPQKSGSRIKLSKPHGDLRRKLTKLGSVKSRARWRKKASVAIELAIVSNELAMGETRSVRFGSVTVSNTVPEAHLVSANVKAGNDALSRAKPAFTARGIKLHHRDGTPTFRVDEIDSKILIREVDGRVERGRIVQGTFVPE